MLMPSLFYNDFDLFDDVFGNGWFDNRDYQKAQKKLYGHNAKSVMSTDIKETDEGYEMAVDLPGFKKENISVELDNGYLTISTAKGLDEDDSKKGKYIRRERYSGEYKRSFYVGDYLTQEDIKAQFKHGVLTLDIPKKDAPQVEAKRYISIEG